MIHAAFGRPLDAAQLAALDADPIFAVSACRVRMLAALAQGDTEQARRHHPAAELLQLQDCPPQMFEGAYVSTEVGVYAFAGDLARLKQVLPAVAHLADRAPGWRPVLHYANAAYQAVRGALDQALAEAEAGLARMRMGEHAYMPQLAALHVHTLLRLGRNGQALEAASSYLEAARERDLGPVMHNQLCAMAAVRSALGEHAAAAALADEAIALLSGFEASGLMLGGAHEAGARTAIAAGDDAVFEREARRCAEIYRAGHNPLLTARYAELMATAERERLAVSDELAGAAAATLARTIDEMSLTQLADASERAEAALRSLLKASHSDAGFLYTLQDGGPELAAQVGAITAPASMDTMVSGFLRSGGDEAEEQTMTCDVELAVDTTMAAEDEVMASVLLSHDTPRGVEITGLALVRRTPDIRPVPQALSAAISLALHQAGDVVTMLAS